jgi:hypothetical protein
MICSTRTTLATAAVVLTSTLMAPSVLAQVDLSGQWTAINQSDNMTRGAGPDLGDYTGLPINAEARAVALSYSSAVLSMTERGCVDYTEDYITFAPHNIMIERVNDPVTGDVLAWRISAGGSDRAPIPIWMDGRPHPSENDVHTFSGFTTGEWEGNTLTGHMTHMKRGIVRRNGAPLSDRATMTLHIVRHGDLLTIMTVTEDPIYLDEPLVQAGSYRLNPRGNTPPMNPTCFPLTELPSLDVPGTVPHFLPGTNPDEQTFAKMYNLPVEAAHGGAQTMYPEYRKRLKDSYVIPPACTRYCCGWGGGNPQASGLTCVVGGSR